MPDYRTIRYNNAPTIKHKRTRFDLSHDILTTFNTGECVPILTEFVNPGETVELSYSSLTRLETSLHQTMDNAYLEFAYFYTPLRILWTDFEKFEGSNDDPWAQLTSYTIPQIFLTGNSSGTNAGTVTVGSLLNHLALPSGSYGGTAGEYISIEALSLRNCFEIYNQWFRDENYDSIIYYSKGGTNITLGSSFLFNGAYFNASQSILKVNRFKDRFSTLLPAPQKGQAIELSLGLSAPVVSALTTHDMLNPVLMETATGLGGSDRVLGLESGSNELFAGSETATKVSDGNNISKTSLIADLSSATAVTINQLRLAIVRQAMLERDARAGTRYFEIVNSRWNVNANTLELDRPEILGGKRIPISMMEVLQTSETGTTVLGSDAGHSKTVDHSDGFVKSFYQHGIVQGFMFVRTARSYSQGIDRMHFIKDYLDMPDPMLDNTGEIAALKKELWALDTSTAAAVSAVNDVLGYQEQYYWIKERPNRFSGYYQPGISGTLDSWHYGDNYATMPQISASWLKEDASRVDRTIAVSSETSFQFSANIHFELHVTRPFAKYSIPNTFGF